MIIKTLTHKWRIEWDLLKYIEAGAEPGYVLKRGLGPDTWPGFRDNTLGAFRENLDYLGARPWANYLYHEIISLKRAPGATVPEHCEALMDLGQRYLNERAPNLLALWRIHTDKATDHIHLHLMLSANERGSHTRYRIGKQEFNQIRRDLEDHVIENYQHLDQERLHDSPAQEPINQNEYELIKRRGTSKRLSLMKQLDEAIRRSTDAKDLALHLHRAGIDAYFRGNSITVMKEGFKSRLQTLGLSHHYDKLGATIPLINQVKSRIKDLENTRQRSGFYTEREDVLERTLEREKEPPEFTSESHIEPSKYLSGNPLPKFQVQLPERSPRPHRWHLLIENEHIGIWNSSINALVAHSETSDPQGSISGLLSDAYGRLETPKTIVTYSLSPILLTIIDDWIRATEPGIALRHLQKKPRYMIPDSYRKRDD